MTRRLALLALVLLAGCHRRRPDELPPEITEDDRAFDGAARKTARSGEHPLAPILIDGHPEGIAICESCHDPKSPLGLIPSARAACARCHDGRGVTAQIVCDQDPDCDVPGGGPLGLHCVPLDLRGVGSARTGPLPGRCGRGERPEAVEVAPALRRGFDLLGDLGCASCHAPSKGDAVLLGTIRRGRSLAGAASELQPGATALALGAPVGLHARYAYELNELESRDFDRLLGAGSQQEATVSPGSAPAGRALAMRLLCDACHDGLDWVLAGTRRADDARRSTLGDAGLRLRRAWMAELLAGRPGGPRVPDMPDFHLSEAEAADLAAYLATLGAPPAAMPDGGLAPAAAPLPPLPAAAQAALVAVYNARGCGACHEASFATAPPPAPGLAEVAARVAVLDQEAARARVRHQLRPADGGHGHVVAVRLSDGEAEEVALALRALARRHSLPGSPRGRRERSDRDPRRRTTEQLALRLRELGCGGCHDLVRRPATLARLAAATAAPPSLVGEGLLVRGDWLRGYLEHHTGDVLRPAVPARMPDYALGKDDLSLMERGFAAEAGVDAKDAVAPATPQPDERAAAAVLLTGLRCASCHADGHLLRSDGVLPEPAVAPALTLARARLRPEAVLALLERPTAIDPQAVMPALFESAALRVVVDAVLAAAPLDGGSGLLGALPDDPERAILLVRDLVFDLDPVRDAALLHAAGAP